MIDSVNSKRIASDAYIAADALEGIIICGRENRLHEEYLKEKVETAQRCIDFMKHFYGGENDSRKH